MNRGRLLKRAIAGVFCLLFVAAASASGQEIEEFKKQLAELKLANKEQLDQVKSAKELRDLCVELKANEKGRLDKLVKYEDKLKKFLSEALIFEMNKKIDSVVFFQDDDEIIARADSFQTMNTVLKKLTEKQSEMAAQFGVERQKTEILVSQVEAKIANKQAELEELKRAELNYMKEQAGEMKSIDERMLAIRKKLAGKIDLDKEKQVTLFEQLLDRIEALEAENRKLKK